MRLNEGLNYHDMVDQVTPVIGIDEFQSRIGEDSDIIVLNFTVAGEEVGNDLVDWLERGYDWIIDAEVSPGEVLDKKYFVFAELNRRTSAARRIMELLEDLYTLTDIKAENWKIKVGDEKYPASVEAIEEHVTLMPSDYKKEQEGELNEWRNMAGLKSVPLYQDEDPELTHWKRIAGVK